jgi:hypothetical protein
MDKKIKKKGFTVAAIILALVLIIGIPIWWLFGTQAGRRSIKTLQSNVSGIERTVSVYDINGNIIKEYTGIFDIEYDDNRILFDDENGKRHIIYYTTGTVIIDEH